MAGNNLSKDFSSKEFACHCGCGFDAVNRRLVDALQKLRDELRRPIKINSACRCERHNAKVGGVKGSQHTLGIAADIVIKGMTVEQIKAAAERIPAFENGGIGIYPRQGFVHVDVRNKKARWQG